ncbi:histone demethylase [Thraustotheca clavata]|uniref:[histone H3]-trimethyl-L-lysine(4) demethylase n=1 Tax=Thraustotheca clavata TaxID=74557 RepID=A0A1W0A526_9STRA|nr:histone demethylase [Thraustotheca clavata]
MESESVKVDTTYDGFVCPPCKIYYPTPAQFQNPLHYIASIREEAQQTGICKIVPPKGWRPPFAVNEKKFRFRTRVQPLYCIEGNAREEGKFVDMLRIFLYRRGTPMNDVPQIQGKQMHFQALYRIVQSCGGFSAVENDQLWPTVVSKLNENAEMDIPMESAQQIREMYQSYLLAFENQERETSIKVDHEEKPCLTAPNTPASSITSPSTDSSPQTLMKKRGRGRPRKMDAPSTPQQPIVPSDTSSPMPPGSSYPGFTKRGRGRPRKNQGAARILMPDEQEPVDPSQLEPEGLRADPDRTIRLLPPIVRLNQKFYRAFQTVGPLLGEVKRVLGGKKPSVQVEYSDGGKDTISYQTMQFVLANGSDPEAAKVALLNESCQWCLRGDCRDKLLICDGCTGGFHTFCLNTSLENVPEGDWYCEQCMQDKEASSSKFGFEFGSDYTLAAFKAKADQFINEFLNGATLTPQEMERKYWQLLNSPNHKIEVEYGSDVDTGALGSGFPIMDKIKKLRNRLLERWRSVHLGLEQDPAEMDLKRLISEGLQMNNEIDFESLNMLEMYAQSPWNLTNLPKLNGSLLQYLDEDIKGVMVPWIYVGMAFSTFCWHVEDHNFYSISYMHRGAPKTWYGVPGFAASKMEEVMRKLTPDLFVHQPDLHLQLVTMFSPETLRKHGVPVYRATHEANEFIVTFPSSYHGGYNNGFNVAEAVNFATPDWLSWGHTAVQNYKRFGKIPVFSHDALLCTLTLAALEKNNTAGYPGFVSYLLPSLKQCTLFIVCALYLTVRIFVVYDEAMSFEQAAAKAGITKMEDMMSYLESHGRGNSTTRNSARQREAKTTQQEDDDVYEYERPSKMQKTGKMSSKMGGKMMSSKMMGGKMEMASNSRMSRMVLWAGRSGKNQGLRCSQCQQYCYLQAVVCIRCRHVGCSDHFTQMCKCDVASYGCFLHRMNPSILLEYIKAVEIKMSNTTSWEVQAKQWSTAKELEEVVIQGEYLLSQNVWIPLEVITELQNKLHFLNTWRQRIGPLLEKTRKHPTITVKELQALIADGSDMGFVIQELDLLKSLLKEVEEQKAQAQSILQRIVLLKVQQGRPLEEVDNDWIGLLKEEAMPLSQLVETIQNVLARLNSLGVIVPELGLLMSDLAYVNWLLAANTLLTRSATNVHNLPPSDWSNFEMFPSIADLNALWSSPARNLVLQGWKLDKLAELRTLCESERLKLTLDEKATTVMSVEELESIAKRLIQLPAVPMEAITLIQRLKDSKKWESTVSNLMEGKIVLNEALKLESQADAYGIPVSSLLRRQLHNRIQDARRWQIRAFSLFKHPMAKEEDVFCLQNIMDLADVQEEEFASLVCVCHQVYSQKVPLLRCSGCCRLYHPVCVGVPTDGPAKASFLCQECSQARRKLYPYRGAPTGPLYCLCRESIDNVPMICCDFCDEWYHAKCISISPTVMSTLEAYRCNACAIRQGMGHLIFKRKARPTIKQVLGLIARGESLAVEIPALDDLRALVDRGNDIHNAILNFEAHFFSSFSIRSILPRLSEIHAALNNQLDDLRRYESLVQLETSQKKLRAIHWCVRACQLTLANNSAPRYSQLVILLADAKQDKLEFPNDEMNHFYGEIEANVERAVAWVESVKRLHLDPSAQTYPNLMSLRQTAEEISRYLVLPDTAVTNFNVALKYHSQEP